MRLPASSTIKPNPTMAGVTSYPVPLAQPPCVTVIYPSRAMSEHAIAVRRTQARSATRRGDEPGPDRPAYAVGGVGGVSSVAGSIVCPFGAV